MALRLKLLYYNAKWKQQYKVLYRLLLQLQLFMDATFLSYDLSRLRNQNNLNDANPIFIGY